MTLLEVSISEKSHSLLSFLLCYAFPSGFGSSGLGGIWVSATSEGDKAQGEIMEVLSVLVIAKEYANILASILRARVGPPRGTAGYSSKIAM